ncbi:hypothetical protein [Massilia sp. MS-15]|uniref:hypothetical protein n=1 Tax=Massilia sp. MS-15 TaxID=2878200 RepID=UPI001CD45743|nr:hypothetical protein [Massilia sp. MS-15]
MSTMAPRLLRSALLACAALAGAACTLNAARPLPAGGRPAAQRAVIVYGVQVAGHWPHAGYTVQLAEYDVGRQNITGDCWRFTRTEARVAPEPGGVSYFAFDVPPGHYVYSPFHGAPLAGPVLAFAAPAGRSVYIGHFTYGQDGRVSLDRQLGPAQDGIRRALPGLDGRLELAQAGPAARPRPFLCAP